MKSLILLLGLAWTLVCIADSAPADSQGYYKDLADSQGYYKDLADSQGYYKDLADSQGYYKDLADSQGYYKVLADSQHHRSYRRGLSSQGWGK